MIKIRVFIVDDHALLREGICNLLDLYDDIEIVGEASRGKEAIEKLRDVTPDVILMDLVMPGMNGLEAMRIIAKKFPAMKILVLTQYETKEYILSAIKEGAAGYICKTAISSELLTAIRTVNQGASFLNQSATATMIEDYRQSAEKRQSHNLLSPREKEIFKFVVAGYTSRNISEILHISISTVVSHRTHIGKKLNIHNYQNLIKYAMVNEIEDIK